MDPKVTVFNLIVFASSALLVGIFSQRRRWGLAPLHLAMGLILASIAITGRVQATVPFPGDVQGHMGSVYNLSLILVGVLLIYALEGTAAARRSIIGLGIASVVLYLFREVLAHQLISDGLVTGMGRERWLAPKPFATLVSAFALMVDGVTILVVYQGLHNFWPNGPVVLAFVAALVLAMVVDGLVYGGLSGQFDSAQFFAHLWGKLVTGGVAAIPPALYISYEFKRFPERVSERGLLSRSAFEVVSLKRELKQVRSQLQQSHSQNDHLRNVFGRYVAPDVVNEILEQGGVQLGGELRDVTIVFTDIRGYSTLAESMTPVQTIDLLNEYFTAMGEVITHFRGTIIEFEGDAILVVFGAPLDQPDHAIRAVKASLMMLEVVDELNERWDNNGTAQVWRGVGLPDFRIRIGIHTGEVVVGNVGSQRRAKYAAIGDAVNTAARVEALNKTLNTTLLMTKQTAEQADFVTHRLIDKGEHRVRGRSESVRVLTVRGLN